MSKQNKMTRKHLIAREMSDSRIAIRTAAAKKEAEDKALVERLEHARLLREQGVVGG